MIKKKEPKKPSAKEGKLVKSEEKKKIFDVNGKLIIQTKPEEKNKTEELQLPDTKNKQPKVKAKTLTEEETQEIKRTRWKKYYHRPGNKEKYAEWNRKWREKQKKKQNQ